MRARITDTEPEGRALAARLRGVLLVMREESGFYPHRRAGVLGRVFVEIEPSAPVGVARLAGGTQG